MLLQMALFHSFLWLNNIPLYRYTTSSLSIPLPMDIYVASMEETLTLDVYQSSDLCDETAFMVMITQEGVLPRKYSQEAHT